jgi:dipeptidase E
MKLLLTSSGITNSSIEYSLIGLVEKSFGDAHVTFIPTAMHPESGDKSWVVDDMQNFKKLGFASFDVIDLAVVSRNIWLPSFQQADILVFGGWNVKFLIEWIEKSGVKEVLPELLKTKVYVGISAGSMVTATHISLSSSDILYYEETGNLPETAGLGFIDFEIRPHLNSKWFPKVRLPYLEELSKEARSSFYAIDDSTAIQLIDGEVTVITEGEWKKFD